MKVASKQQGNLMPSSKPGTLAIVFFLAYSLAATAPGKTEPNKTAASGTTGSPTELANHIARAYGGMARIKEMLKIPCRSHVSIETRSNVSDSSNKLECEVLTRGEKLRTEMEIIGQKNVVGFNGKIGWTDSGGWVCPSSKRTVERLSEELHMGLNALESLDDPTCKLELLPSVQIENKKFDVLKMVFPDGKWNIFHVDPLTKLVSRCEYMTTDPERGVPALKAVDYRDYRNVLGFPTPFRTTEFLSNQKTQEVQIDAFTVDESIKDNVFEMPPESKLTRLTQGPVTIPFEYLGNEIVIDARINGGESLKFIVDTGATQTILDKSISQTICPLNSDSFSLTAGGKAIQLGYTKPFSLQIGDLNLENLTALVTDLSKFSTAIGQRPAGMIGANILKRFLVTINYSERKLIISDPELVQIPDGATVIPTIPVFNSSAIVVKGTMDDTVTTNFLVDTGAGFNNLPLSQAEKLRPGSILPVGQILGLDPGSISTGSIKLKNLKLGSWSIQSPVFTLVPNKTDKGRSGLFAASAILGNPVWSKTKLSLDYRNDRIFVEIPADQNKLDQFVSQLETLDRNYLKTRNIDAAAAGYEQVLKGAENSGPKSAEALCLSRLSSLYADRYAILKESRWLDMAAKEYERAAKLAAESRDRNIEGQILASWAMLYLSAPRSSTDLISAQNLLRKALARAPMDSNIYAALGSAMIQSGKIQSAGRFIDQSLMLDPSNWQALWAKYKIFESEKKDAEMKLLLSQFNRYYPDFPQVKELSARLQKQPDSPPRQSPDPRKSRRK